MSPCLAIRVLVKAFVAHFRALPPEDCQSAIFVLEEIAKGDESEIPDMIESLVEIVANEPVTDKPLEERFFKKRG